MIGFPFVVRRPAIKLFFKKQVIGKNKFNKLNCNNGYCNCETFHFFNIHILKHINIGHIIIYHESFNFKTVSSIIKYKKNVYLFTQKCFLLGVQCRTTYSFLFHISYFHFIDLNYNYDY